MKRVLCLILALITLLSLFSLYSCSQPQGGGESVNETAAESGEEKLPDETDGGKTPAQSGNSSPYSVFDPLTSSKKTAEPMVKVSDIADQYKVSLKNGVTFDPLTCPYFEISGFPSLEENKSYYRMLLADASKYPSGVNGNATKSAGGRIRFRTNSSNMTISVTLSSNPDIPYMTVLGSAGIDIYKGTGSAKTYFDSIYPSKGSSRYTETIKLSGSTEEYTLVLPLYSAISNLTISLDTTAQVGKPTPYTYEKPVVFYGSSITQGCSASRPGTSYTDVVTRMLDANLVNLGFSGGAKGEQIVADYIAGLEMSAFVLDYDYNASSVDDLKNTHYNFYKTIRDAHPDIPIIIMTKNNVAMSTTDTNAKRRAVIKETYDKAVAAGDKNVYFIDGRYVYPEVARELCTVDGTHPTDIGMYYMAQAVYPILKQALEGK